MSGNNPLNKADLPFGDRMTELFEGMTLSKTETSTTIDNKNNNSTFFTLSTSPSSKSPRNKESLRSQQPPLKLWNTNPSVQFLGHNNQTRILTQYPTTFSSSSICDYLELSEEKDLLEKMRLLFIEAINRSDSNPRNSFI
ncbi:12218_t:CDS:2 [Ambispora gerdemannii]|uniref:12218_t:CDS:1 n=1 Tax=Ambispora gerdemannii TaxID=144530 RepID=A0A9N8ZBZ4_9GLOM|nr:12218_t:CDS:2 [Ambispora gerdemannii]